MRLRILEPIPAPDTTPLIDVTIRFTAIDHTIERTAMIGIEWTGVNDIFTVADLNDVADDMMEHLTKLIKRVGQ